MSMKSTIVMDISINDNKDISTFNTSINTLFLTSEAKNPLFEIESIEVIKREEEAHIEVIVSSIGNDKLFFIKQIDDLFFSFPLTITCKREYFEYVM